MKEVDCIVIGAGITGLTAAWSVKQKGKSVFLIERDERVGGKVHSFHEEGFTFESGPNTGVVSCPEVAELFASLELPIAEARKESKKRLIWKGKRFHALPASLWGGVKTPLFTWKDKFRILGEPWRKKGDDPEESLADLTRRRLGQSYLDYAVNPFISGVYAGDPERLITRYALPKLYTLEQDYGSFIRGAIQKGRLPKTERDRLATKEVFSARKGLQELTDTIAAHLGEASIQTGARECRIQPLATGGYEVSYTYNSTTYQVYANQVVSTVGAYALPNLLPFVTLAQKEKLNNLTYAPIVQVAIGFKRMPQEIPQAFGGLVPSKEQRKVLGVLIPSACFHERTPEGGALLSCFIGGVRHPEVLKYSDEEVTKLVLEEVQQMFHFTSSVEPDLVRIFRHERAVPQYEGNSGERFNTIYALEDAYEGLHIIGNCRDGIGLADRIRQAVNTVNEIF